MIRRSPGLARRLTSDVTAVIGAPTCSPALTSATPADTSPEWARGAGTEVEVMLTDGTWTRAALRARCQDAQGRWCVLLSWVAGPAAGRREGWFAYDDRLLRRPRGARKPPKGSGSSASRRRTGRAVHGSSAASHRDQRRAKRH